MKLGTKVSQSIGATTAGIVIAAFTGCAPAAAPKQNIGEMIANAETASDYEAIADYYDREAADAEAKYEEHEASVVRYENSVKFRTWAWHCERLAEDFKAAEGEASLWRPRIGSWPQRSAADRQPVRLRHLKSPRSRRFRYTL